MDVYDAAERYQKENKAVIILAGKDYGSGNYPTTYIRNVLTFHFSRFKQRLGS